jgi:hypothetical protein
MTAEPLPSFTCPVCSAVSYHPADVAEGYCGRCRTWTFGAAPAARDWALACQLPADCPRGPGPHEFVPPAALELLCCCRQPWENGQEAIA